MFQDEALPNEENNNSNNMIYFTTNNREYYIGENIEGNVYLNLAHTITFNDIVIELMLSQFWQNESGVSDFKNNVLRSQMINTDKEAKKDESLILEKGEYKFPFQFEIPDDIQPSFEYPDKYTPCYHRYTLIVKLESQINPAKAERVLCLKTKPQQFKNDELFTTSNVNDIKSYGLFSSGNCSLSASYENPYVKYSSSVPMKFDINNRNCTLNTYSLKVKIIRKVTGGKEDSKTTIAKEDIVYEVDVPVTIGQETKRITHSALLREENLNQFNFTTLSKIYPNIKEWPKLMPTCNGSLVKCEYFVRGTVYFEQFVRYIHRPRATLPFYVVHISQDEINYQESQKQVMNYNNIQGSQMMNMTNFSHNPFNQSQMNSNQLQGSANLFNNSSNFNY